MFNREQLRLIAVNVNRARARRIEFADHHALAADAHIDVRTLCKVLDGMPVRNIVYERIRVALGLGTVWELVWAEAEKDSLTEGGCRI